MPKRNPNLIYLGEAKVGQRVKFCQDGIHYTGIIESANKSNLRVRVEGTTLPFFFTPRHWGGYELRWVVAREGSTVRKVRLWKDKQFSCEDGLD